jgi:hypothetical protein
MASKWSPNVPKLCRKGESTTGKRLRVVHCEKYFPYDLDPLAGWRKISRLETTGTAFDCPTHC